MSGEVPGHEPVEGLRGEVEVRGVHFARGLRPVFEGIDCRFPAGEISIVAGPSGGGKTTLLRLLARLERPDRGEVRVDGALELGSLGNAELHDYRRGVGMMFQGGALLDSMSIYDNTALPLREHTALSEAEIRDRVEATFQAVDLGDVGELLPGELSGGMTKRAALARALIERPRILLCDEPFSGLDPRTQRRVEDLLIEVNERTGATTVVTSHHVPSMRRMASHFVLVADGRAHDGPTDQLLSGGDERVQDFLGGPAPA